MRPSDITDGIRLDAVGRERHGRASMRPSDITDGIARDPGPLSRTRLPRFNEAVGYYRRNHRYPASDHRAIRTASMRPSDITDGITAAVLPAPGSGRRCFNEAVGYYRRNRLRAYTLPREAH